MLLLPPEKGLSAELLNMNGHSFFSRSMSIGQYLLVPRHGFSQGPEGWSNHQKGFYPPTQKTTGLSARIMAGLPVDDKIDNSA
jgi:hypothetical protein